MSVETTVFNKAPNIVMRNVGGETLLVPIALHIVDLRRLFTLNPVGVTLWNGIDGSRTVSELCSLVVAEYDVTPQEADRDVKEFLNGLAGAGLVVEVPDGR